jgi:hypothetical protein
MAVYNRLINAIERLSCTGGWQFGSPLASAEDIRFLLVSFQLSHAFQTHKV